jgi:hypothetical protein
MFSGLLAIESSATFRQSSEDHSLRPIRTMIDKILKELCHGSTRCTRRWVVPRFRLSSCCAHSCLQMLYPIRSKRLLMEGIDDNILFH